MTIIKSCVCVLFNTHKKIHPVFEKKMFIQSPPPKKRICMLLTPCQGFTLTNKFDGRGPFIKDNIMKMTKKETIKVIYIRNKTIFRTIVQSGVCWCFSINIIMATRALSKLHEGCYPSFRVLYLVLFLTTTVIQNQLYWVAAIV